MNNHPTFAAAQAAYRRRMAAEEKALGVRLGHAIPDEQPKNSGFGDYSGGAMRGITPGLAPPTMSELFRAAFGTREEALRNWERRPR